MGSLVAKAEPGQTPHQSEAQTTRLVSPFLFHAFVSCRPVEKEIPLMVKQEAAESKEPVFEADKFKSRYKKYLPHVPPNPVRRHVCSMVMST